MSVSVEDLRVGYDGPDVVRGVSFSVAPGSVFALLGPSGSGKTTTLRAIAGFERGTGQISVAGTVVADARVNLAPEKRNVGYVFQEYALFPHLSVAQNVAFGLRRWKADERRARVAELLRLVELEDLAGRMPGALSGGQQQRVALARAVAPRPAALLLDEPFSNLDAALRRDVRERLADFFKAQQTTVVFVTHDQEEALALADSIGVMRDGELLQVGSPAELYGSPTDPFVARFIADANVLDVVDGQTVLGPAEGSWVAVRPHELVVTMGGDGTVVGRTYLGHEATLVVEVRGERLRARVAADHPASVGDAVSVRRT